MVGPEKFFSTIITLVGPTVVLILQSFDLAILGPMNTKSISITFVGPINTKSDMMTILGPINTNSTVDSRNSGFVGRRQNVHYNE